MSTFPQNPSEDVLRALVDEVTTRVSVFGRTQVDVGGAPDPTIVESIAGSGRPELDRSIAGVLVDAYLGQEPYLPDAAPESIPDDWRTLREHELSRGEFGGVFYKFSEFIPDPERLDYAGDTAALEGVTDARFDELVAGLTKLLGEPCVKQEQEVEFEWGITDPSERGKTSSGWGGVRIGRGTSAIEIEDDSPPWEVAYFTIELLGKPRT